MDLGGLGAVRGDRPRRPPSTLETEGVLEPGRTEVGGAEPGTSSHRPGRGRPPGSPALRGSSERTEAGGPAKGPAWAGSGLTHSSQPVAVHRPSSPSTRTRSADRWSCVEVTRWEQKSGGGRGPTCALPPRPPARPWSERSRTKGFSPLQPCPLGRRAALPSLCQRLARPGLRTPSPCSALKPWGLAGPWPLPLPSSAHYSQGRGVPRAARTARPLLAGPGLPTG